MLTLFFSLVHQIKRYLSVFNYWSICWWFSWLISLFFDDLSPDWLCLMIVNMLRKAADRFINDQNGSWSFSFIKLQLVLVLVLALTWVCWCCYDSLHPAGGASSLCTDPRPGAADLRGGLRPGWALNSVQEPGTRTRTVYRWFTFLPACVGLWRITGMCWAPGCRPTSTLQQLDSTGCLKTPAHVYGSIDGQNSTRAGSKRLQNVSDGEA